jgi:CxxC motif-containing protein
MCPMGCELKAEFPATVRPEEITVSGNTCPRGREYAIQEMTDPRRNIASSVLVEGGELPLASVRLNKAIPKARIFDVMQEIRRQKLTAPVTAGQVVISDVLGLGSNVIVTKTVDKC